MHDNYLLRPILEKVVQRTKTKAEACRLLEGKCHTFDKKTLNSILAANPDQEGRTSTKHVSAILEVAADLGIPVELPQIVPPLWDLKQDYAQNRARAIGLPAVSRPSSNYHARVPALSLDLRSPFGAAASVLTSTEERVIFLLHTGSNVVTIKTVRRTAWDALPSPNIRTVASCPSGAELLAAEVVAKPFPAGKEGLAVDGLLNSIGMASDDSKTWSSMLGRVVKQMKAGQCVILSVVGSARRSDPQSVLVEDFVEVSREAESAGTSIIELNFSCPNCYGLEGEVYRDVELTVEICRRVRAAVPEVKLLAKIGYLEKEELERFVDATRPFVDGYTVINTFRIRAVEERQYEDLPAFGERLYAGLSGSPVLPLGLDMVRRLAGIRERLGPEGTFAIVGVGGVSTPADVVEYLKSGADLVQAATVFFDKPLFGLSVHEELAKYFSFVEQTHADEEELAYLNMMRALRRPQIAGLRNIKSVAAEMLLQWGMDNTQARELGSRRSKVPSIDEWADRLSIEVTGRRAGESR